jgi:hypothetical protein
MLSIARNTKLIKTMKPKLMEIVFNQITKLHSAHNLLGLDGII